MTANGVDLGASVPCLRTLGTGAQQAAAGDVLAGGITGSVGFTDAGGSVHSLTFASGLLTEWLVDGVSISSTGSGEAIGLLLALTRA